MNVCGLPIELLIASVMATTLRVATPLTLGAMSGLYCERSGVVNIAIEGMMLMGAFCAYVVGVITGNLWLGLVGAVLGAGLLAALHALLSVTFRTDQIISGTVINILAIGLTTFFADQYFARESPSAGRLDLWAAPALSDLPVFGPLFVQQPVVWFAVAVVLISQFVIYFTRWGLRTRAVGEHPRAADTVGVNVFFMRYANVIIGGAIAGLAGSYFIVEIGQFSPGMTAGRGFIALAALIFGKWTPLGAWGAALFFGLTQAIQINIQQCGLDIPNQFIGMLPYVVTIIVLAGLIGRSTPPASLGIPYEK